MWKHFKGASMVMEDLQDYLMIKAMSAKSKLAFRKCSGLCDIDIAMEFVTQPNQEQTEGEGDKNAAASAAGEPKPVSVYKIDMHCEGCCKKIRRAVKHLEGVESAKTDRQLNKLMVTGEVDPKKVKARLEKKMKKEVEIVSPQPKKDGGGAGEKKPEVEKADEKAAEKKPEVKKPPPKETGEAKKEVGGRGDGDDEGGENKNDAKKVDGGGEIKKDAKKVDGGGEEKKDDNKEGVEAGKKKSDGKKDQAGAEAGEKKNKKKNKKGDERGEEAKVKNKEVPDPDPATATAAGGHGDAMAEVINKMDYYPAYVPTSWLDGIFAQSYTVDPQQPQYSYDQTPVYNYGHMQQGYYIQPAYNHPFSDDNARACSIM